MKKVRCPICDKGMDGQGPKEWPHWPFCSQRCRTIDLGRWLGGDYRIATPAREEDLEDALDDSSKPAVPSAVPNRDEA
jgi:endogenous inhibitor of DNA gyrase (YacG/DUF329 family)